MARRLGLVLSVVVVACASSGAAAQDLEWNDEWPRVRSSEVALTATLALGSLALDARPSPPEARWTGGLLFDDAVRALALETRARRTAASEASDVLQWVSILHPVVDALLVAWVVRGARDVAWEMLGIDALAFATAAVVVTGTKLAYGRERPFARGCATDPDYHADCASPRRFRSFASAHAVLSATGAGLTCAHHGALPLYGAGAADALACAGAVTVAFTTALLRILSDEHFATDILLSAALGAVAGYALPTLLHYDAAPP